MTKSEIDSTIEATKFAISNRIGNRAKYSTDLKRDILMAALIMGPSKFSKASGLAQCLISEWNRKISKGQDCHLKINSTSEVSNASSKINETSNEGPKEVITSSVEQVICEIRRLKDECQGGSLKFSARIRSQVLESLSTVGVTEFCKRSGLSRATLHKWKSEAHAKPINVREVLVKADASAPIATFKSYNRAIIRAGSNLEIEVPVEIISPSWLLEIARNLGKEPNNA